MKTLLILCQILVGFSAYASESNRGDERIYESRHGDIYVHRVEEEIEKELQGDPRVLVTDIRWSRNPWDYFKYGSTRVLNKVPYMLNTALIGYYVVEFNIDRTHQVACAFDLFYDRLKPYAEIRNCDSDSIRFEGSHRGPFHEDTIMTLRNIAQPSGKKFISVE